MARPVFRKVGRPEEVGARRVVHLDRDRPLVEAAQADPARFDALYRKYLAQVYSYALYELARPSRGRGRHGADVPGRPRAPAAVRGARPARRRRGRLDVPRLAVPDRPQRRRRAAPHAAAAGPRRRSRPPPTSPAPLDLEADVARRDEAAAALARARPPARRPPPGAVLRFVDEMSTAEIAGVLGRSEGAVRVLIHRALRSVARDLGEDATGDVAGRRPRRHRDRGARHRPLPRGAAGRARDRAPTARPRRSDARPGRPRRRRPARPRPAAVHPSFRFEEALAAPARRAAALGPSAARRPPARRASVVAMPAGAGGPLDDPRAGRLPRRRRARRGRRTSSGRCSIGGALTSAALSLAGAAFVAWRRRRPAATPDGPRRPGGRPGEARLMPLKLPSFRARRDAYPADLWTHCPSCETMLFNKQLDKAMRVCPTCGHHFRLSAAARLEQLLDEGTFEERDAGLQSVDPLGFVDQKALPGPAARRPGRDRDARRGRLGHGRHRRDRGRDLRHGLRVHGRLDGRRRRREGHPGRRARARGAGPAGHRLRVGRRADAGGHAGADAAGQDDGRPRAAARRPACRSSRSCPTRRPAACSPRSRRSATSTSPSRTRSSGSPARASRPGRSPRSCRRASSAPSSCSATGSSTGSSPAPDLRDELIGLLRLLPVRDAIAAAAAPRRRGPGLPAAVLPLDAGRPGQRAGRRRAPTDERGDGRDQRLRRRRRRRSTARATAPGRRVQLARNLRRPRTLELLAAMADEFVELHGDRLFGDDEAIVAGLAPARRPAGRGHRPAEGRRHRREHPAQLRHAAPRGLPQGDAGHGARRALRPAGRHVRRRARAPTPAPSPRSAASPRRSPGRSALMTRLRTPIVTVITGEGGSGGALAIAVGDVVLALENAVYSVISPEGCASILWRTRRRGADRGGRDADDRRRPARARRHRRRRPGAGRGRPHRPRRDRPPPEGDHRRPARGPRRRSPIDELVEQRYRRYRSLGVLH